MEQGASASGFSALSALTEVNNIKSWAEQNLMPPNLAKTKGLVIKSGVCRDPPVAILLVVMLHEKRSNWDDQFDN